MTMLELELRNAGWAGKTSEFRDLVEDEYRTFIVKYSPAMTPSEFLLRPLLALEFADHVRGKLRAKSLHDHTILGSLVKRAAA
jgi:hypothetical protein